VTAPQAAGTLTLTVLRIPTGRDRNHHALHQAVTAAADMAGAAGNRALWSAPTPGVLLVQAPRLDPARISGAAVQHTVDVAAALAELQPGTPVRIGLIANPCRTERVTPDGRLLNRSRRVPLPHADRPGWLRRQLTGALTVTDLDDRALRPVVAPRPDGRATLARHLFTGAGTVDDPQVLARLVRGGVGPGKAYGCGLLTVRKGRP